MRKIRSVLEQLIDEKIEAWNKINGYDIESIISALGFTFDEERKFGYVDKIGVKRYISETGTYGSLELSLDENEDFAPMLFEVTEDDKQLSQIMFTNDIITCRYVEEENSRNGMVISTNSKYMQYFSSNTIEINHNKDKLVVPDEVRSINEENPIIRIQTVKQWADEINNTFKNEESKKI